ncbi:MAG: substrate-binding domain-containing protein [Pseudomonadota bacterium]
MTITLKELSGFLELSQTTVSRALNGYPEVSETTRQRVMTAAKEHGYSPNPRAKSLATGRAMTIGHIVCTSDNNEFVNPIFSDFLSGAGVVYTARGYSAHLSFVEAAQETEQYRRLVSQRSVDGVIVHAPKENDPRIALLQDMDVAFGVHGCVQHGATDYNYVEMDNFAALDLATDHLASLGHCRMVVLNGPKGLNFAERREDGHRAALTRHGISQDETTVVNDAMTEAYGYDMAMHFLSSNAPPTAFLAGSIVIAMGVQQAVLQCGLTVGRDISIVAHDDVLSYLPIGNVNPKFTVTRSSVAEAGGLLAEIVIDQVEGVAKAPRQEMLQPHLVVGQSSGPPSDVAL